MSQAPIPESPSFADGGEGSIFTPERITQTLVIAATILFCVIFIYGARIAGWPHERGFEGSLSVPPAVFALIVAIVLLVMCTALGTAVLGRRWFLAGLMTATAGLATWSVRGGWTTFVLFHADNSGARGGVFFSMLVELIVFFGVIGALWTFLWTRNAVTLPPVADKADANPTPLAIAMQSAMMMAFVMIFVFTAQKKQVLAGVFFAGLISTWITDSYFAGRSAGRWYWVGPLLAGAVGYILCALNPAGIETGDLTGVFAPMARVLPLDYASLGCAGALMGYWLKAPEEEDEEGEKKAAA